ncbi:MAG: type I 3-dehydroquinate dehydratase [Candidatus Heimdallarchaeota archaeon]|nr:type I 3-dehydroquinate dehydratase [Candidatus Heimdallarchaeota archaeon]
MNRVVVLLITKSDTHLLKLEDVLFEFRLDQDPALLKLLDEQRVDPDRVILTVRSEVEGGTPQPNRSDLLDLCMQYSVKYLDREIQRDPITSTRSLILSEHNYQDSMLVGAKKFVEALPSLEHHHIYKFVGKPHDTLDLLEAYELLSAVLPRYVILGIGKLAEISRTCLPQEFVFGGDGKMIMHYQILLNLSQSSSFTGLLGCDISHSRSPELHQEFYAHHAISGYYHVLEASDPNRARILIRKVKDLGFRGINVTIPYKHIAAEIADMQSDDVRITNACNTLKFSSKIEAHNTDVLGFRRFLRNNKLEIHTSAAVIGAGGAARAVAFVLQQYMPVTLYYRSESRLDEFSPELYSLIAIKPLPKTIHTDLIINATPVGFLSLAVECICKLKIDLKYHVDERVDFSGMEMLYYQARAAFNIWHDIDEDLQTIPYQGDVYE